MSFLDLFKKKEYLVVQSGYLAQRALELDEEYQRAKEGAEAIQEVLHKAREEAKGHIDDPDYYMYMLNVSSMENDYILQATAAISYAEIRNELIKLMSEKEETIYL